jgi:tetratricopeptide (TPR) repeat protein
MQSLDQAFAIDKNYYEAWLVRGRIQEARGQSADAVTSYWAAAKASQTDVRALGSLGNLYDQSGNAAGAARAAFELVQRTPESADAKTAFALAGLNLKVDQAVIDGRQSKLSWTTSGKMVAESYRLVLVRPDTQDVLVAEGIAAGLRSIETSIPQTVPDGPFRLRLYAMAPLALAGVQDPWVAWAESDQLTLKAP